jgi:hypothetical protein
MNPLQKVLDRVPDAQGAGNRFSARCPAHDNGNPSLSIVEIDDGTVLVKCSAGCPPARLLAALGLTVADLFPALAHWSSPRRPRTRAPGNPGSDAGEKVDANNVTAIVPRFDHLATARGGKPEGLDPGEDVADLRGPSGERAPGLGVAP